MTQVWRICRRPFADLLGEGAKLHGGRWNSPGRALIYTADSVALAVLEVRVHLDLAWDVLPDDYVLMAIHFPASEIEDLVDVPSDPVTTGNAWLASRRSVLSRVPSVIVPESFNILINPGHPEAESASIASIRPFQFDERLWLSR